MIMEAKRIRITHPGIFDAKGERIKVGTVMSVPKDFKGWANKWQPVDPELPEEAKLETGDLEALRAQYKEKTGKDADSRWKEGKLKQEIEAASK